MATLYLDLEAGSDAADGTSFANRKKTLAGASAIAQPGDTVRIMASTTPNSLGVDGTFAKGSTTITLASAVNAAIDTGETAWTASASVTTTTSTTRKQGSLSTSIAPAAGFTTGLAAYKALGGATDFSSYQQISFWFQQTSGTLGGFDIKLCSDAAGATPVDTLSVPAAVVLNGWNRVTINKGSALGASIQSVAFYVTTDSGAQTYILDNIVACKAPGTGELSHKTLIGKANSLGAGGDDSETWYAIRAIEGTTVTLDLLNSSNAGSTTNGRYWGTSETVTAYSLFPSYVPTSVVSADLQWTAGGTDTQTMTISGGWDRTDMTTQGTGQTWLAVGNITSTLQGMNWFASYLAISNLSFIGLSSNVNWNLNYSTIAISVFSGFSTAVVVNGVSNTISGLVFTNGSAGATVSNLGGTTELVYQVENQTLTLNSAGHVMTLSGTCVANNVVVAVGAKLIFNGTTYGSFGEASAAAAVMASVGDTGVSLAKATEMLAALAAGKVSASSAAGVTTLTYKKRDGTTTSFTVVVTESDKTRATTGALS